MQEHLLNKITLMGGWYIPTEICDNLINFFKEKKSQGKTIEGMVSHSGGSSHTTDYSFKKSEDYQIKVNTIPIEKPLLDWSNYLSQCVNNYVEKYDTINDVATIGLTEQFNIQHYNPGGGFYKWHFEKNGVRGINKRVLVFMTYLNDVPDGGTEFKYQDLTTPAKKGLTVIWPAEFTHTHRGQISEKYDKYIITGWLSYVNDNAFYDGILN